MYKSNIKLHSICEIIKYAPKQQFASSGSFAAYPLASHIAHCGYFCNPSQTDCRGCETNLKSIYMYELKVTIE